MSSVYGQPQAGTVQSGSIRRSARCPAAATVDAATPLIGVVIDCRNIVTTAGAGEPTRMRWETRSCSREAIAHDSIPPRLWPTKATGPGRRSSWRWSDRSTSVRRRSGHPALMTSVDRSGV